VPSAQGYELCVHDVRARRPGAALPDRPFGRQDIDDPNDLLLSRAGRVHGGLSCDLPAMAENGALKRIPASRKFEWLMLRKYDPKFALSAWDLQFVYPRR
jgi:hypothetical protein